MKGVKKDVRDEAMSREVTESKDLAKALPEVQSTEVGKTLKMIHEERTVVTAEDDEAKTKIAPTVVTVTIQTEVVLVGEIEQGANDM